MKKSVEELVQSGKLTRMQLLELIKGKQSGIYTDIMRATSFLTEDAKYMPAGYREDYIQHFSKAFLVELLTLKRMKVITRAGGCHPSASLSGCSGKAA